jgi:hypothetical protein
MKRSNAPTGRPRQAGPSPFLRPRISNRDTPRLDMHVSPALSTHRQILIATERLRLAESGLAICWSRFTHHEPRRRPPRESWITVLIGSPVIRISSKPRRMSHLTFSNRRKTKGFASAPCGIGPRPSELLVQPGRFRLRTSPIATLAIRNAAKSFSSIKSAIPNRDRAPGPPPAPFARIPQPQMSRSRFLLGSSVIRNPHKQPRINHLKISNRHKTAALTLHSTAPNTATRACVIRQEAMRGVQGE